MDGKNRWLDTVSKYASIVEAVGLLIAVASISVQWSQENRIARAERAQAVAEHAAEFHYKIIESDSLTEIWYGFGKKPDMTPTQRLQYRALLEQYLILQENAFIQHDSGLLDERLYRSLESDLKTALANHDLKVLGNDFNRIYTQEFVEHMKQLTAGP
jgi:hypothetical protein